MNFWLTTHWPLREREPEGTHNNIFIVDGREEAGRDLRLGERVLIYELKSGPTILDDGDHQRIRHVKGRGGIVVVAEVTTELTEISGYHKTEYEDRDARVWRWIARTRCVDSDGFVPREEVNRALGYAENYSLRSFGDKGSGLKKLTRQQFETLLRAFKRRFTNGQIRVVDDLGSDDLFDVNDE